MNSVCPHCGKDISEAQGLSYGERVTKRLFEGIGGPEGYAEGLAESWLHAEGHKRYLYDSLIKNLFHDIDKFQQADRHHKDITAQEQIGALKEYAIELMQTDDDFRTSVFRAIKNRKLLTDQSDIIDAEYEEAS